MCPSLPYWQCRVVVSADRGDLQTRRHERRVSLLGQRHSILGNPSGFLFAAFVSSQPHVTRFPASECGTCFGLPDSPRLWPLAPSAPQGVTACCSQVSQLLWPHLLSFAAPHDSEAVERPPRSRRSASERAMVLGPRIAPFRLTNAASGCCLRLVP